MRERYKRAGWRGVARRRGAGLLPLHYPAKNSIQQKTACRKPCVRPNHTEHRPLRQHAASSSGIDCGPPGTAREDPEQRGGACESAGGRERSRPLLPDILLYTRS
ncbi:hypothetical protein EVAR_102372_1 [Eumeta japonica]|uniref:Uncharacterized protein n=1 Tax=Eumeta variegata TaxID=151549 RepID=A0A4C2AA87_EUMVA|nr:hypothetical protein EVAR_102372_1 [Eumeta japonica]